METDVVIFITFCSGLEADILFGLPLGCLLLSISVRNYLDHNIMGDFNIHSNLKSLGATIFVRNNIYF